MIKEVHPGPPPAAGSGILRPRLPARLVWGRPRREQADRSFSTYLAGANRTRRPARPNVQAGGRPPSAPPPAPRSAPAAEVGVDAGLFDRPVEPRFAHAVDPAELKEVRLGVMARRKDGGLEVEAVVLDQAGRPVPDAVVLAMVDPSGPTDAAAGGFLPNTDVFGRTRGTVTAAAPQRVRLIVVTGNGLQVARELELPPG